MLTIGLIVLVASGGSTLGESLAHGQETHWIEHDVPRTEVYQPVDPSLYLHRLPPVIAADTNPQADVSHQERIMVVEEGTPMSDWHEHAFAASHHLLQPYQDRAFMVRETGQVGVGLTMPQNFVPWWRPGVTSPQQRALDPYQVDVERLIYWALKYSPYVRAISDTPLIHETAIEEAEADFDWVAFTESKFIDLNDPVGSDLTTGGPDRFRDHNWTYNTGVRRKTYSGGRFEISQQLGYEDSNSTFFVPTNQGTTRLSLNFTQPLLKGRGRAVNTSLIVLAEIETSTAWNDFSERLQDHLLAVTQTYWELYLGRASLLQRQRHLERAEEILETLENRREIDAMQSQIMRAQAAVATRQAELVRARTHVRNAETRIRALVNAPELTNNGQLELIPVDIPGQDLIAPNVRDSLVTALRNRPEVDAAISNIQAASVRLDVSKNRILPVLNLFLESYVSGLNGNSDIGRSLGDQFSAAEPSYTVGLQFEVPLGNRAAQARYRRRKLEARQLFEQFRRTVENLMAEVEVAVREVRTTTREMHGHYRSMIANQSETDYQRERWQLLPGEDGAASFLLEDLLDSQDRLVIQEFAFVEAQLAYMVSLRTLNRAMGTLLDYEQVFVGQAQDCGLPLLILDKPISWEDVAIPPPTQSH